MAWWPATASSTSAAGWGRAYPTLRGAIASGPINAEAARGAPDLRPADARPQTSITDPEMVVCVGLNYCAHTAEGDSKMKFSQAPVLGTCDYARESPAVGGDTIWSNQMPAFDALSPAMQRMLAGLKVMHSAKRSYGPQGTSADDDLRVCTSRSAKMRPRSRRTRAFAPTRKRPQYLVRQLGVRRALRVHD